MIPKELFQGSPGGLETSACKTSSGSAPTLQVVAQFLSECSSDPDDRTAITTSFVLSCLQLSNTSFTNRFPSLLLLRNDEAESNPLSGFLSILLDVEFEIKQAALSEQTAGYPPKPKADDPDTDDNEPDLSFEAVILRRMAIAHYAHHELQKSSKNSILNLNREPNRHEKGFFECQDQIFGAGRAKPYCRAWSNEYGFTSDRDDALILRLRSREDRDLFRSHLAHETLLLQRKGIGKDLQSVTKALAFSGQLSVGECSSDIVERLLCRGEPVFILPHLVSQSIRQSKPLALQQLLYWWKTNRKFPVVCQACFLKDDWSQHYETLLSLRLSELPSDYSFAVQRFVRELLSFCVDLVATSTSLSPEKDTNEAGRLIRLLHAETLRGLTISVSSLAWYGMGLPTLHPPELIQRALELVRKVGCISCRDLQRKLRVSAKVRDEILLALELEGLIKIRGTLVERVSFNKFVKSLYRRPEFVPVPDAIRERPSDGK